MNFDDLLYLFKYEEDNITLSHINHFLSTSTEFEKEKVLTKKHIQGFDYHLTVLAELSSYNKPLSFEKILTLGLEDINLRNGNNVGPLSNAIINGAFLNIVKLLIEYGANAEEIDSLGNSSVFHYICSNQYENGHLQVLEYFLTLPINHHHLNYKKQTPFFSAFTKGNQNYQVINILLNSHLATVHSLNEVVVFLEEKMLNNSTYYDQIYPITQATLEKIKLEEKMNLTTHATKLSKI